MQIHRELGPGFKENIYHKALTELLKKESQVEIEKPFNVYLGQQKIGSFRADIIVNNKVIVEVKAINGFMPKIFQSQIISYLKASNLEVGLLLNFGNLSLDFKRFVV